MSKLNGKKEKILGIDLDPSDRLDMKTDKEGYPSCTIDNKKCTPTDYLDLQQENADRHFRGQKSKSLGSFSGWTPPIKNK